MQRFALLVLIALLPPAMAASPSLDEVWRQPPTEARLWAYWWWLNGNVDRAAITHDLEQMKAKGFGGAIICDAGGAEQRGNDRVPAGPVFGSGPWRALLRHALREGDRLGLQLSLNIQSGWNLGGPGVTPDDAVKKLVVGETTVDGGAVDVAFSKPNVVDGYYRDLFVVAFPLRPGRSPSGGVANWRQKTLEEKLRFTGSDAFFRMNSAPDTAVLVADEADRPGEEDCVAAEVVNISDRLGGDGRLRWQAPPGRWQVLRFGCTLGDVHEVSTHSDGWAGYAIDVFDRGAFDRYAESVVVPLLDEARGFHSLRYLHTDSWEVDLVNWTPTLREEFRRRRGYDPLPYLPAFAGRIVGSRTTTNRFLNDYRKTLGDLAIDNHYRPFHELAARYGLGMHPESGGPHYTPIDAQRCLGLDDVPMSEFWARSATHRTTEASRFFVKQPASAAHTNGRRVVAAEGFTSIGPHWQETLWDNLKPSFDHAIAEGLNRLVWHAFVCSPESMGVPGQQYFAGSHLNPNVTWWDHSDTFFAYINRCQAMMQRGRPVADVLYYYGDHVPNFAQLRSSDPAQAGPGYDYDVISEEALLTRTSVKGGRIELPDGVNYRLLVLPRDRTISLPVMRKVKALVAAGATVVGEPPIAADSLTDQPGADQEVKQTADLLWTRGAGAVARGSGLTKSRSGRALAGKTARDVLVADGIGPDVEVAGGAPIDWIHRRDEGTDIYFLANRGAESLAAKVSFRVIDRAPELWDPMTGEQRFAAAYSSRGDRVDVPLALAPYGSMFVIFRSARVEHPATGETNERGFEPILDVNGSWIVTFDPKWGGPASATFERLVSWTKRDEPEIRFYSGKAVYRTTFTLPATNLAPTTGTTRSAGWCLDLGEVREIASVRLNDRSVGVVWAPPFRVDVTPALRAGRNELAIEVVNFWPNRIIGDAALPPARRLTRTNITQLKADTPLMPSGLLGPVVLLRSTDR